MRTGLQASSNSSEAARQGRPPDHVLFEPIRDVYGPRLALVFGNEAPAGRCPFVDRGHCLHCDIGLGEGRRFREEDNRRRLAWYREHFARELPEVRHLVIYNSGSVLSFRELSPRLLQEMLLELGGLPRMRAISLDSREGYITARKLRVLTGVLPESVALRPILGLETIDDHIRTRLLAKRMARGAIVRAFEQVGEVASELGTARVGMDVNILLAGPGTSTETAVEDARATARFALDCAERAGIAVDFNVHPHYPSRRGEAAFGGHRRCSLPVLARGVTAIVRAIEERGGGAAVFVGWNDEGHDQEPARRARELRHLRPLLDDFNTRQDPSVLAPLVAAS